MDITTQNDNPQLTAEEMAERLATLEQENEKLREENAKLDRELTKALYKINRLRSRVQSGSSIGQVVIIICVLAAVLLFIYGMGFIELPDASPIEYDRTDIERIR